MCNKKDWSLSLSEQASLCAEWHEFLLEIYLKILPNIREATKRFLQQCMVSLGCSTCPVADTLVTWRWFRRHHRLLWLLSAVV